MSIYCLVGRHPLIPKLCISSTDLSWTPNPAPSNVFLVILFNYRIGLFHRRSRSKRERFPLGEIKRLRGIGTPPPLPPPKPTSTLTRHLGQIVGLREGLVGSFLETYNDSNLLSPNVLVKSRILGFGIGNTAQGIRNPSIYWIPESKFH